MISLQEKKRTVSNAPTVSNATAVINSIASYAKRDFAGAIAMFADDAEVSGPTGSYVGKGEILSQLRAGRPPFRTPRAW